MLPDRLTMSGAATARLWTLWLPIVAAVVPAAFFVLIGSEVRQPDGIPYRCPSAVRQLVGDSAIRPTVHEGELRLYDPRDPALVDPPGVADRCRRHNVEGASIAFLVLMTGLTVGLVRSGALRLSGRGGTTAAGRKE